LKAWTIEGGDGMAVNYEALLERSEANRRFLQAENEILNRKVKSKNVVIEILRGKIEKIKEQKKGRKK
jgi:hypothetical protein